MDRDVCVYVYLSLSVALSLHVYTHAARKKERKKAMHSVHRYREEERDEVEFCPLRDFLCIGHGALCYSTSGWTTRSIFKYRYFSVAQFLFNSLPVSCWTNDSNSWILRLSKSFSRSISSNFVFNIVCNCMACSIDSFEGWTRCWRLPSRRSFTRSSSVVFNCKSCRSWSMICSRVWMWHVSGFGCERLVRKRLKRRRRGDWDRQVDGASADVAFVSKPVSVVRDFFIFDVFFAFDGDSFFTEIGSELLLRNFGGGMCS